MKRPLTFHAHEGKGFELVIPCGHADTDTRD